MTVRRFECASAGRLSDLLASDPNAPYRAHRGRIGAAAYDAWTAKRGASLLCNSTGAFEADRGAIGWKRLDWDTSMFGFPAARVDILVTPKSYGEARSIGESLIKHALEEAADAGVRHIVARVDSGMNAHAHALEARGFELLDGIQTFALSAPHPSADPPPRTRLVTASDADAVGAIARSSFIYDRFHNDAAIGEERANHLHDVWARNSVAGQAANAVLLATSPEDSVEAFVTVKVDETAPGLKIASIPLVATALASRGRGVARRATLAALAWCHEHSIDLVEVGTQISNVPAARLYQSLGFKTTAISLTYRKLIGQTAAIEQREER